MSLTRSDVLSDNGAKPCQLNGHAH